MQSRKKPQPSSISAPMSRRQTKAAVLHETECGIHRQVLRALPFSALLRAVRYSSTSLTDLVTRGIFCGQ